MPNVEYSKTNRGVRRTVIVNGRSIQIEGADLRELGAPNWLARKVETRQAEQVEQEEFRAKARRRAEAAMSPDPDVQRRAKADLIAEEIAADSDDDGPLDDDGRALIRALRQVKRQRLAAGTVS